MKTAVGIFSQRWAAELAAARLHDGGIPAERINVLAPGADDTTKIPTTDTEQGGTGAAIGGVVGAAGGLSLAFVSAVIPGIGMAAAAILGLGGAVGGAAVGAALEENLSAGIPKDEVQLYQSAVRQGRSVVFALVDDAEQVEEARKTLLACGAESLDPAGHDVSIGFREALYAHK